jgi:cytochrome bd-type quinol oxidase subunit 1
MSDPQISLSTSNQPSNLPNATATLVLGIISLIGAFCYGIVGVICGIIGLVLANKDRKLYQAKPELYSSSSYSTLNAGRVCSIIGLILGSLVVLIMIFYIIFFGAFFMEAMRHSKSY